jgi:hypothetical protein
LADAFGESRAVARQIAKNSLVERMGISVLEAADAFAGAHPLRIGKINSAF